MLDHYTLPELAFKINCRKKDLYKLAMLGQGFDIMQVYPTTAPRYMVKKSQAYGWMDCVKRDPALTFAAKKIAPHLSFYQLTAERNKWAEDRRKIYRGKMHG